ncbi:MAG: hypothetical protein LBR79_05215 [Oscillospiraceae bacterium]|nr:hypothetical protein [Oscillospiraceae bacterium]
MRHDQILMQSYFLSDTFFDNLRSVRFTDRSIINQFGPPPYPLAVGWERPYEQSCFFQTQQLLKVFTI